MPGKWGAAAAPSHAPPTAHNLSGLSGGLSDTARARRGALEAENGALRAQVASANPNPNPNPNPNLNPNPNPNSNPNPNP